MIEINNNVLNQKQTPALFTDVLANRPNFGLFGRLFFSTDSKEIYQDTGTAWQLIGSGYSNPQNLQQVTTIGNTTTLGIVITGNNLQSNNSGSAINASLFSIFGSNSYTGSGTETAQYQISAIGASQGFNLSSDFTPFTSSKHGAISGTAYKQGAGSYLGTLPAVFAATEFSGSGSVTTATGLRVLSPKQQSGFPAFTGNITNAVGLYIEDISSSPLSSNITNKYAIYQPGLNDINVFNGTSLFHNKLIQNSGGRNFILGSKSYNYTSITISGQFGTNPLYEFFFSTNATYASLCPASGGNFLGFGISDRTVDYRPNDGAILTLDSITKAFGLPNLTTTAKNNVASPSKGYLVFDTTLNKLSVYTGSVWETVTSS